MNYTYLNSIKSYPDLFTNQSYTSKEYILNENDNTSQKIINLQNDNVIKTIPLQYLDNRDDVLRTQSIYINKYNCVNY